MPCAVEHDYHSFCQNGSDGDNENGGNGNGENRNGENGNGGNENSNENNRDARPVARECTYQDFMKCQPINFKGTEGGVGLIRWFEKMETVFHISNCLEKYQVKYATCILLNSALTWWNLHKRTIGTKAPFVILRDTFLIDDLITSDFLLHSDFYEDSDDEVDERSSEEYLRDLDIEYHERALLANSKYYKTEYKKMKAKLAVLKASSQNPKTFQPKNKGLVTETFDWDEEDVSDEEEVTQVKVPMALANDELTVGKNHARSGELVDITMRKVNTLLSVDEDADWQNYLKYINIDLNFVEEQRLNLLSNNKMVFELNKCRDELLILKQAKLDGVTF
uniref:Retrovirus-related Pol polyprotein from transposon TNT 1-94 n=1 Tax=Tanacetum cinerariifolium TaxID=118510 RepID=A0A699GP35_TANCI|nr:retrovirus-related Pol polyprotein from transposon TNT 1-94 [Tanacetum cinerariifolium]